MSRIEIIGNAHLHLCDYRELLRVPNPPLTIVTDPPYGIDFNYLSTTDRGGEPYSALIECMGEYPRAILQYPEEMMRYMVPLWGAPDDVYAWCYESNLPRQFRLWGFWGVTPNWSAVRQPAKWAHLAKVLDPTRASHDWCSDLAQVKNTSSEKTKHPCQVPVALVERILGFLPDALRVLDPFMGSGTTGVACVNLGRKFIGCEIDPTYFDIACRRIEQAYKQPRLFEEPIPKPEQLGLI